MNIKNIVAFCILMENNDGVLSKSPDYIEEKFQRYCTSTDKDLIPWGLDYSNRVKLEMWVTKWLERNKNGK